MIAACRQVKAQYPHITPLGCLAHTLHLLIGDLYKLEFIYSFVESVVAVVKKIRGKQVLNALFKRYRGSKFVGLHLPGATRWGSILQCLQSVKSNKKAILKLLISDEGIQHIPVEIRNQIVLTTFWEKLDVIIDIMSPVVKYIIRLEGNDLNIHQVYLALYDINSSMNVLLGEAPSYVIDPGAAASILLLLENRKQFAVEPIYLAAYLLDPYNQGNLLELLNELTF